MQIKRGKKAQITIFVILAIAIIAVLLVLFLPDFTGFTRGPVPDIEIGECLDKNIQESVDKIMIQGGSLDPEAYFLYNNETIEYLCYTNEWYKTCVMQKPLLKQAIEREIEADAQQRVDDCIREVRQDLESRGFSFNLEGSNTIDVNIIPGQIDLALDNTITIEKGESTIVLEDFSSSINSDYYRIIMVATSILNWEARYGDAAPETYMIYYPDLRVEKKKQSDGTTIYILTNKKTEEVFKFASRSLAWPPGYAY